MKKENRRRTGPKKERGFKDQQIEVLRMLLDKKKTNRNKANIIITIT